MIKVIAFDLVGVLVKEKDNVLNEYEEKVERLFGPNISDEEYFNNVLKIVNGNPQNITNDIINKLYVVKDKEIIKRLKIDYPEIIIIVATNHISLTKDYIKKNIDGLDDIIISSEIKLLKNNPDFYQLILNKYHIKSDELLFIDDIQENIDIARSLDINTIKVNGNTNIYDEIKNNINKRR